MPIQTPVKKELFASTLKKLVLGVLVGVLGLVLINGLYPQRTDAATADTVNFQAKLMTSSGAIAADGNYNVEFKLYNVSSGGTALWTEDYLDSASRGVRVANGYLTVNLGQYTPFPSTINWDQDLWIGMNIGGTGSSASWDGEMTPRLKLTAVPYAFSAGNLSNLNGSVQSTLVFQGGSVGNQIFQLDDQGAAGTYHIATTNNVIQNQWATTQTNANFKIQGSSGHVTAVIQGASGQDITDFVSSGGVNVASIDSSGNVLAPGFDTKTVGGTLQIGQTNATGGILLNQATTLSKNSSAALVVKSGTETQLTINTNTRSSGTPGNVVQIGNGGTDTTTTILQLDSSSAIPTTGLANLNGGLYYNTNSTNGIGIHAISNGADVLLCDSTGSCGTGSIKLQIAYNNSTAGTPEIKLNNTQGAVDIQDADTSLGATANLFAVRGSNSAGYGSQYFAIQGNGNVGIGTSGNPSQLLSVGGTTGYLTVDSTGNLITSGTGQFNGAVKLAGSTNTTQLKIQGNSSQSFDLLEFTNAGATALYSGFSSGGDFFAKDQTTGHRTTISVSNGTLSADHTIYLPNANGTICTTAGNCIGNGGSGDVFNGGQAGPLVLGTTDTSPPTDLTLITNNEQRVIIKGNGNVGIGTTITPSQLFSVGGSTGNFTVDSNGYVTAPLNTTTGTTLVCQNTNSQLSGCDSSYLAPTEGNFIRNQNSSAQTSANFWIDGTGIANILQVTADTGALDTATAGKLNIGGSNASEIDLNQNTLVASGKIFTVSGGASSFTGAAAGSGTAVSIVTGADSNVGLSVTGTASQSADIARLRASSGDGLTITSVGGTQLQNSTDSSTLSITSSSSLSAGHALIQVNDTSGNASDALIDLQNNSTSEFSVDNSGNVTAAGTYNTNTFTKNNLTFGDTTGPASISGSSPSSNGAGNGLTISGGAATAGASAYSGGNLTLQGGAAAGTGNATGGNVVLQGGAGIGSGVQGLVELAPTAFSASAEQDFASDGSITGVDSYSTIPVNATAGGLTITLPAPDASLQSVVGRILYVTAVNGSNDFSLAPTGAGASVSLTANGTATMVWNGTTWTNAGVNSGSVSSQFIKNQSSAAQTATFWINGVGRTDTAFIAPKVTTADITDGSASSAAITLKSGDVSGGSGLNTGSVIISSGSGSGTGTNSGDVLIDVGAATGIAGNIKIGTGTVASSIQIGQAGVTTTNYGDITIGGSAGSGTTLTNNGSTVNATLSLANFDYTGSSNTGSIGTAANTVDKYTSISIDQTQTPTQTLTVPSPTNSTGYGRIVYVTNIGSQPFMLLGSIINPGKTVTIIWSHTTAADSWTLAGVGGGSGDYIMNQTTQQTGANFNIDGTGIANKLQVTADTGAIDTATAGKLNIGDATSANATQISLNVDTELAAGKNLVLESGSGTVTQNYTSTTPGTATTINATNGASNGVASVVGIGINLAGTDTSGTSTNYGVNFGNVASHAGTTYTGLNFGTGYDYLFQSADASLTAAGGLNLGATDHKATISVSNSVDSSTLSITSSATLSSSNALIDVKDTSGVGSNKLINLENGSGSVFSIDAAGNVTETNSVTQTYTNNSGNGSANSITATNGSVSGSNTVNGLNIGLLGTNTTGTNTNNGINFANVTNPGNNTYNGLNFGTGYNYLINSANFTVSGTGVLQGISASLTGTDALTIGSAGTGGAGSGITGGIVFQGADNTNTITLQGPSAPTAGNYTLSLPAITGNATVCTTNAVCGLSSTDNYLVQVPTSNGANTAGANVISPTATGVVGLTVNATTGATAAQAAIINQTQNAEALQINNSGTNSALSIIQSAAPSGNAAAIFVNDTNATATNKLINLQANGNNKFTVTANGVVTLVGGQTADLKTADGTTSTTLTIQSGNASSGAAGNVVIDTGTTTSGTPTLNVGTTNAKAVAVGNTNASFTAESNGTASLFNGPTAHTVQLATGNATQTVQIGSTNSGSTTELTGGAYNLTVGNAGVGINAAAPTTGSVDLFFGAGSDRVININQAAAGIAGNNLTIQAGGSGSGAVNGGNLILQGGATGGSGQTGDVIVKANGTDSETLLQIQDAGGTPFFGADSVHHGLAYAASNTGAFLTQSDLTNGNRSVNVFSILQDNSATYSSTGSLLSLQNLDTDSSGVIIATQNAGTGASINITQSGALSATSAVILVNDTSGNNTDKLVDLRNNGASKFTVDASGNVIQLGNQTFAGTNPTISASATNGGLSINANGTGTLALDSGSGGTINIASSNASSVNIGNNSSVATTIVQGSGNSGTNIKLQAGSDYLYVNNAGIGIGTTTPKTALDVAGAVSTLYNNVRTYENVYSYGDNTGHTGTYELILPATSTNTLLTYTIKGFDYGTGGWQATISGGNNSGVWYNTTVQISGAAPFSSIRLVYDSTAGRAAILLGTTTTAWVFPQVSVTQVVVGYAGQDNWGSGYSSAFLATESGFTNVQTPTVQQTANTNQVFLQGGNSFGTTAVLGTNDNNGIQVRTNGTTRFTVDTSGNAELTNTFTADVGIKTPAIDGNSGVLGVGTNTTTTSLTLGRTGNTATNVYSGGAITITAGASSTWSTTAGDLTVQAAGNLNLGTAGAGTVGLGDANATTINIGRSSDIARTINVGTGGVTTAQAVNIGSSNSASSTIIKGGNNGVLVQSASTTAFRIQDTSNNNLLTADTSSNKRVVIGNSITPINTASGTGDVVVGGNLEVQGKIYFGNSGSNAIYTSGGGGQLRFKGTARNSVAQTLTPEYAGAVMTATGSGANVGTMTSDFCANDGSGTASATYVNTTYCPTTGDYHNYYNWTTSQATAQDYDIFTRWQVPSNYDSSDAMPTITFYGWRTNTTNDAVTLTVRKGATVCGTATSVGGSNGAWNQATYSSSGSCGTLTPGTVLTFDIHLSAATGDHALVGEIGITYNTVF